MEDPDQSNKMQRQASSPDISHRPLLVTAKRPSQVFGSTRAATFQGERVTEEEADAILQEFADADKLSKKTLSRMFVENVLMNKRWYFPKRENGPSLSKAWAYYEHVTLPRHFVGDGQASSVMRRCEPGEHDQETELYSPMRTPQASLIEWGTGVDLYFISLRFFAFIMLLAGLINIFAIDFYNSSKYRGDTQLDSSFELLKGSAICSNTRWVVCRDCNPSDWDRDKQRFATGTSPSGETLQLVLRNFCPGAKEETGYVNFATLIFLIITVGIFSYYLRLREIRFDEDKVTTTDYSVMVTNPPPDALDIDEWRAFFDQYSYTQVTCVTIALNNEQLIRKLIARRTFRNQLRIILPKSVDLDDESAVRVAIDLYQREQNEEEVGIIGGFLNCCVFPILRVFNMFLEPHVLVEKVATLTDEIKELQEEKYDATAVYVTFETEEGQRAALSALTTGKVNIRMNNTSALAPGTIFRDRVLNVREPPEPDAVRWLDLSASSTYKIVARVITFFITIGLVGIASVSINGARATVGPFLSGPLTTIWNSIIPVVIKIAMIFERHSTEGSNQASLYLKITLFRWMLSAILVQVITPFTSTLGDEKTDMIPTIYAILLSDVWLAPLLRMIDIMSNLKKHILAPRAMTQEGMNLSFQGTFYNLGERYTDFTKVLFVCFFYSAVFPAGFFFGAVILFFQYMVDKYCLMRIWGWTPSIGSQLAEFSRQYFFTGALLAYAVTSAFAFLQFPYDNLCVPPSNPATGFSGTYTNVCNNNDFCFPDPVEVVEDEEFIYCDQSWQGFKFFPFPSTSRIQTNSPAWIARADASDVKWMTEFQEDLTDLYGWFSFVLIILFIITYFGKRSYDYFISIFIGTYEPEGSSQHIDFSSNPEIYAFVPQIKLVGNPFPFLACDIDNIDQGMIGWNDPAKSYDYYNLIFDIPHKSLRRKKRITINTRNLTTIAEHEDYVENSDRVAVGPNGRKIEVEHLDADKPFAGARPIYSIVKHYPTKWQIELMKKDQ